jgi:hypothetical protein
MTSAPRFPTYHPRCFTRATAGILLASTAACTTFGTVPTREFITAHRPPQVWVFKADSSVVLMRGPHFIGGGDTLVGMVEGGYQELPLSDVQQVKASRSAPMHTALLVVGGVAVVVGAATLVHKGSAPATTCTDLGCDNTNNGIGGP